MKYVLFISALFLFTIQATGQSYEDCLELVKQNKREKALSQLSDIVKKDPSDANAYLLTALLEAGNQHYYKGFKAIERFCEVHPNPYPYIYAFANSGIFGAGETAQKHELKQFFQKLKNDTKAPIEIRSFAIEKLAKRLEAETDTKASAEMYKSLEDVENWSTVGVFQNISESGFNKDFGVVDHPEESYVFTNKNGAKVKWFEIPSVRNDRWWDFEYNYDISDAIIYAQTFVKSDEDKELLLKVGVSGSVKIWLNDFLVGAEKEERNTNNDVYVYKVRFQKGYNRLLLQLGSGQINRSNFMVRLANVNGDLISNVESDAHPQPYTKAAAYTVKQIPFFAEQYFEEELEKKPEDFVTQLLLLDVYNHNDKKYKARKVAAKLKKEFPVSTMVSEKLIEALRRDGNQVDLKK
jgi:predicted Zn-dependent protease